MKTSDPLVGSVWITDEEAAESIEIVMAASAPLQFLSRIAVFTIIKIVQPPDPDEPWAEVIVDDRMMSVYLQDVMRLGRLIV